MRPNPLSLQDAPKKFCHDQEKIITPQETVQRFKERLKSSGLQILDKIVRIDNGRLDIPVYFSVCGPQARAAIGNYKQMGKGATPAQSQASAVMELAERFSLFSFYGNRDQFLYAPFSALKAPAMDFDWIARSVGDHSPDLPVARRFFSELPLQWTWSHNLTQGETVMVPFNWFWTINQFNGASAGNCIEEALCQGICEVVERHVCAVISHNKHNVPLIDPDSIQDPVARELLAKYNHIGVKLYLSDFTFDMGIPSVGALAYDPQTFPEKSEIVWTAGTMPSANKALCRALTEVAQLAGDFNSSANYEASGLPKFMQLDAARYVTHPGSSIAMSDLPEISDPNIKTEVERCINAMASRNMDIFTVDVAHPALKIPAFYTMIPGTHFRERAPHASVGMIVAKIMCDTFPANLALSKLEQFDTALPGKYYLQFYLGQMHLNQGHTDTALTHFTKALDLEPPAEDMASIWTYIGLCHKESEQYQTALSALKKADQVDPERTDTLNLMGFCHFKLQAHEHAIACFQKLVTLNPSSAIDYANIAANYRALGDRAKAIHYYQLALKLDDSIDFAKAHLEQLGIEI
jgi:ribosomal protein S12 methylthiotransferase accessory factor